MSERDICALCHEEYEFETCTLGVCEDCEADFNAMDAEDQLETVLNLDKGTLATMAQKNAHVLKRKY